MAHEAWRRGGYHLPPPALTQFKMPVASSTAMEGTGPAHAQLPKAEDTAVFLAELLSGRSGTAHNIRRHSSSTRQDLPFILVELHQGPWQPAPAFLGPSAWQPCPPVRGHLQT